MVKKTLNRIKDGIASIILVLTLVSGGVTFAWCKLAKPEIKKQIVKEQKPIIDILLKIKNKVEFNTYLQIKDMPQSEYDTAFVKWNRFKLDTEK